MANYNLAFGGDPHYNENYAMYPQNALVSGRPEFGASTTVLKPGHHFMGGVYTSKRHMNFNDECHECGLREVAQKFVAGDTFLTHIIPGFSVLRSFGYKIHTPAEGASFTVQMAGSGLVLGTIDASVAGCGWFDVGEADFDQAFVPCDTNDAIEIIIDAWPDTTPTDTEVDPCGVFGPCETPVNFCWSSFAKYDNPAMEDWCEETCYDTCAC